MEQILEPPKEARSNEDRVFDLLLEEDEISWQAILTDLVAQEKMDPWDIDISLIAVKFLGMLKKLKETDFRVSGKVVLASAILLRIKSQRLVDTDLAQLQRMMEFQELDPEDPIDALLVPDFSGVPHLLARTPQPRKRKVSLYDLMNALEKALEVQTRRKRRVLPPLDVKVEIPEHKFDLSKVMSAMLHRIQSHFHRASTREGKLLFTELNEHSKTKKETVQTFIPLLHLDTMRKIDLIQEGQFGDIEIQIARAETEPEVVTAKE